MMSSLAKKKSHTARGLSSNDSTYPACVGPSSPAISTLQSLLIRSVRSIASKKRCPMGTSLDVSAATSDSDKVKRARKRVIMDLRVSTSCLYGTFRHHVVEILKRNKLTAGRVAC